MYLDLFGRVPITWSTGSFALTAVDGSRDPCMPMHADDWNEVAHSGAIEEVRLDALVAIRWQHPYVFIEKTRIRS